MWFSTLDDGVYYYRNDRLFRLDEEEGFSDLFIYDLHEDDDGNIWAGTDGGLAKCTLGDSSVTVKVFAGDHGLPDIIIKKIKRIGPDTLSLATEDAGVVMFNTRTYQSVALATPWLYGSVSDHVIKQNQIWIAARGSGLVVCDRVEGSIKVYGESAGQSLRTAKVLLTDLEGNIWAGLRTGLVRTMGDAVELIESLEPCTDTDILALAVDQRERIWFSSKQGLFIKAKTSEGASTVSRALQNTPYEKEMIISLFADNQGYIWAGLYGNGLLRIDPTSYRVKHYRSELRNGNVLSISGAGDNLWIATLGGGTLLRRTGDDYQATNYSSADGLSSDFVYQAFIDSRGRVWLALTAKE